MKKIILYCLCVFTIQLNAQDSLLYEVKIPEELFSFYSDFQEEVFAKLFIGDTVDELMFFVAADSSSSLESYNAIDKQLEVYCLNQKEAGVMGKSAKKQIKILYQRSHDQFLDKYELENQFTSVFEDGRYNCVSGTALFARVFDALEIPYRIEEFPTHVMLIAFPEDHQIAVETTDPNNGYLAFTDKMKIEFANELRANKMISEAEYQEGPEAVFNKNYLVNDEINLLQLAGVQYLNNAVYALNSDAYLEALNYGTMAFALYPCEASRYTLVTAAGSILENGDIADENRVRCLSVVTLLSDKEIRNDYVIAALEEISKKQVFAIRDTAQFTQAFKSIMKYANDSLLEHKVNLYYNYEMGRYFVLSNKFKQSADYLLKAFAIDTINIEVGALTEAVVIKWLGNFPLEEGMAKLDSIFQDNPSMANRYNMKKAAADGYMRLFGLKYRDKSAKAGERYRLKFQELVTAKNFRALQLNEQYFVSSYSECAIYYYTKSQYKKTKEVLQDALSIDPSNSQIKKLIADFR